MTLASDPRSELYLGRYAEIVDALVDQPQARLSSEANVVAAIGALSFLGRVDEAKALLQTKFAQLSPASKVEARFYLAVALRRHHRSAEARHFLGANVAALKEPGVQGDDLSLFFTFQGLGFHRYADGRIGLSLHWSQKAYDAAFRAGFVYGRVLSLELKGHSQINSGAVNAGFHNLAAASKLAQAAGRGGIAQAAETTTTLYRASLGYGGAAAASALEAAIKRCEFEDSYTLASLYLERARFSVLIGRVSEAKRAIEDASHCVYRLDHPILDAQLSLRMAQVAVHRGDVAQALSLVRSDTDDGASSSVFCDDQGTR